MKKIFIVAGDPSGDVHAARLMEAMKQIDEDLVFRGIGGSAMIKQGLETVAPIEKMSVVGFWEVAKKYGYFKRVFNECVKIFDGVRPDVFIPVDYPGFNIGLAKEARKRNIKTIYYIAPQLWAWGRNRAKKLSRRIDLLLAVFPFEVEFFKNYGINVEFVGHPLLDNPVFASPAPNFESRDKMISFFPGSREQEIKKHLPIMKAVGEEIEKTNSGFEIAFSRSNSVDSKIFGEFLKDKPEWKIYDDSIELMRKSRAGVVKTGTSNLEAALCGMPFVMIYKTSFLSYRLSKILIELPFISIINILADKRIISEKIQNGIDVKEIAEQIAATASEKETFDKHAEEFKEIKKSLGENGASKKAAEIILDNL